MKYSIIILMFMVAFASCRQKERVIVERSFVDSLLQNYSTSQEELTNKNDLSFWETRMDSLPDNYSNGPKYAGALAGRFRLYGDIHDLKKADSLIKQSNLANQEKEGNIFLSLANFALQQHQFTEAEEYVDKARQTTDNKYGIALLQFDVAFEKGQYEWARSILKSLKYDPSYAYFFRKAKYEHYDGSLDSAINYLLRAAEKTDNNSLIQAALSNAADLCVHKGDLQKAYSLYKKSIQTDASDHHSIAGIGWIALVNDKNDSLAERIFSFVHKQTKSPDMLLKMEQVAEFRNDSLNMKKYAAEFAAKVTDTIYGNMYNKYMIGLYTGILYEPGKAVALAEKEIYNRPNPQTYAWYAWALMKNGQKEKAGNIFKTFISGKPLEGLELFYMGMLMKSLDKGFNAQQYFKAAYKNRYDLSPLQVNELQEVLE